MKTYSLEIDHFNKECDNKNKALNSKKKIRIAPKFASDQRALKRKQGEEKKAQASLTSQNTEIKPTTPSSVVQSSTQEAIDKQKTIVNRLS